MSKFWEFVGFVVACGFGFVGGVLLVLLVS